MTLCAAGKCDQQPSVGGGLQVHLGFNGWEVGTQDLQLAPTSLWRGEGVDWWSTPTFQVPKQAYDLSFCFTDGHGTWDSNDG